MSDAKLYAPTTRKERVADSYRQKLKVTELKELLVKHNLPQTGKKEDLVKRLLDAGVTGDEPAAPAAPAVSWTRCAPPPAHGLTL